MRRLILASTLTIVLLGSTLVLTISWSPIASADPTVRYAKPSGATTGVCDSWANACDLPYALTTAISGTEIWIARGVYTPGLPVTSSFQLKSGVALYGGFALTETARDQRDWQTNLTVLSGDIDGNDTTDANGVVTDTANLHGANAWHVLLADGIDTVALDGLIVTAGNASGDVNTSGSRSGGGLHSDHSNLVAQQVTFSGNRAAWNGGGMWAMGGRPELTEAVFSGNSAGVSAGGLFNEQSNPALTQVVFEANLAGEFGGGMVNASSSPATLISVTFSHNRAITSGGGMVNINSSPLLTKVIFSGNVAENGQGGGLHNHTHSAPRLNDVTFLNNTAAASGGGMSNWDSSPLLINVTFAGNSALDHGGGGMDSWRSTPTLINVLFSGNAATNGGGGLGSGDSYAQLTNVTFSGNRSNLSGGGLYLEDSQALVVNSIVWGNTAPVDPQIHAWGSVLTVTYNDIQGSSGGTGNLDVDPQFVAPITATVAPTTTGDYRLQLTSPAIDAGNNLSVTVSTDLAGHPRNIDVPGVSDTGLGTPPIVDLGAYEAVWPIADAGNDQTVCAGSLVKLDGSASSDPAGHLPLSYGWTQTGGEPLVLTSNTISQPTFTASVGITRGVALSFTLVVTNSLAQLSAAAEVVVKVNLCLWQPLILNH